MARRATPSKPRLPRDTLNQDHIVRVALEVAAEVGFDGLSMSILSERLSCTPMAIYRHVRDKRELLDLMADAALATLELPSNDTGDWTDRLRDLGWRTRELFDRMPGLASFMLTHRWPQSTQTTVQSTTDLLCEAGFDRDEAAKAEGLIGVFILGHQILVEAAGDTPLFGAADTNEHFRYSFDRVIDGLAVRLEHLAPKPARARSTRARSGRVARAG